MLPSLLKQMIIPMIRYQCQKLYFKFHSGGLPETDSPPLGIQYVLLTDGAREFWGSRGRWDQVIAWESYFPKVFEEQKSIQGKARRTHLMPTGQSQMGFQAVWWDNLLWKCRVVLGLAASLDFEIHQMDVKTAFLHGERDFNGAARGFQSERKRRLCMQISEKSLWLEAGSETMA